MIKKPLNKIGVSSAVNKAADAMTENARIAKMLYENHNDTRFNKTTGKFEDSVGTPISPQEYLKDQKNLQKAVDGLSPNMKDFYYDVSTQNFERRDNPPPHVSNSEKEQKIHTPAYRRKYPERYGHKYTSTLDQVAYPKPGTAPSEKVITDTEIQKRLDMKRGLSDWDAIKAVADQPEDKKQIRDIIRASHKRDSTSTTRDELKYLKPEDKDEIKLDYSIKPWVNPEQEVHRARDAALEKTREYAFTPRSDPDAVKGIGSFRNTIGRKLRAANSKSDWEKSIRARYEDNSDA